MKKNVLGIIIMILLIACQPTKDQSSENETIDLATESFSFTPKVKYAKHFSLHKYGDVKAMIVKNPWDEGDTLVSYALNPKGSQEPALGWAEFKIPVPIDEVVATSSPHVGFISLINELERITGVADDRYIFDSYIYDKISTGQIAQVGSL